MADQWPYVRRSRSNPGSTATVGPKIDPKRRWKHSTAARIFGTPLVADNRVYVATGTHSFDTGSVVALDRRTGERLWAAAEAAFEVRGTPGLYDGKLYVVDLDSAAFVVDATNGDLLHHEDNTSITPPDGVCPLASDGTVCTTPYRLEARDADSWSLRWSISGDDQRGTGVVEPPAICDETVIAACGHVTEEKVYIGQDDAGYPRHVKKVDPSLKAFAVDTGSLRWERSLPGRGRSPAVVDGVAYLVTNGSEPQGTVRVNKACGDEHRVPDDEPTDYHEFGTAHAIDVETGTEYWSQRFDGQPKTMPAVYQDTLCYGTAAGTVVALDAGTGAVRWETRVNDEGSVLSWPTIAADTIYVGSRDECLYALNRHDGSVRWQFDTESSVASNPAVIDGTVFVGDDVGNVYAIGGQ